LENISQTNLTYGYDLICKNGSDSILIVYKTFEKLLNEMNILPIYLENNILDIEAILPFIDLKCGFKVEFPEIFDYSANSALICSRGKISSRMMYALYYVYNIAKNVENISEASVLEIGAGTGRTAYYAFKFGFKKYTIVDIISTQIVQAHYNFNLLGTDKVSLYGEDNYNNCFLNLCPADKFNYLNDTYDIICNFDGLTEYGIDIATNYLNRSMSLTKKFLSINHSTNSYSFTDLYSKIKKIKKVLKETCDYRIDINLDYYKEIIEF
jgi:SAM-dependent methyltransferase